MKKLKFWLSDESLGKPWISKFSFRAAIEMGLLSLMLITSFFPTLHWVRWTFELQPHLRREVLYGMLTNLMWQQLWNIGWYNVKELSEQMMYQLGCTKLWLRWKRKKYLSLKWPFCKTLFPLLFCYCLSLPNGNLHFRAQSLEAGIGRQEFVAERAV